MCPYKKGKVGFSLEIYSRNPVPKKIIKRIGPNYFICILSTTQIKSYEEIDLKNPTQINMLSGFHALQNISP